MMTLKEAIAAAETHGALPLTPDAFKLILEAAKANVRHDARVSELLEANNTMLERARSAERRAADANRAIADVIHAVGILVDGQRR